MEEKEEEEVEEKQKEKEMEEEKRDKLRFDGSFSISPNRAPWIDSGFASCVITLLVT